MAIYTMGTLTNELRQFYDLKLLERALPELVHSQFGQSRDIPASQGVSIQFRKYASLPAATTALTEGTPPSASTVSVSTVSATVSQYGAVVDGSDIVSTQTIDNTLAEIAEMLGENMGNTLDIIDRTVLIAGTNVMYASTAGSRAQVGSGMFFDAAEIREAVRTLKRANAKMHSGGKFIAILHPDTVADMFGDGDILDAFQFAETRGGGNPVFTGELGHYLGVRFVESTNAQIWASAGLSGADVYATLVIGANAYGITELTAHSAQTYFTPPGGHSDPLEQSWRNGWKAAHVCVILDQNNMVRVEHNTSYSLSA